jgi:PAS domain S-box-containing protein
MKLKPLLLGPNRHRTIVLAFLLFGLGWIFFTDDLLHTRITDPEAITLWQNIKGVAFVVLTSAVLYLLLVHLDRRYIQTIRLGEQKYRALFNFAPDAVLVIRDKTIIDCNAATATLFQGTKEDIVGRTPCNLSPPRQPDGRDSTSKALEFITRAEKGDPQHFEWEHRRCNGSRFTAEIKLEKVALEEGPSLLATVKDVSKLKTMSRILNEQEGKYQSVIENVNEAIVLLSADFRILTWNTTAEKVFGLKKHQVIGKTAQEVNLQNVDETGNLIPYRDYPSRRSLRTGEPVRGEVIGVPQPDGGLLWISFNTNPLFRKGEDSPYAVAISGTDITKLKKTQEELAESEKKFRQILNSVNDGILVIHAETGRIQDANDRASVMFGCSKEELVGADLGLLSPGSDPWILERLTALIQKARHEKPQIFAWEGRHTNGSTFPVEVALTATVMNGKDCVIAAIRDITERKHLEEQLLQAQKMESLGTLASGIAHDFNNILQGVSGYVSLLADSCPAPSRSLDYLNKIQDIVQRGSNLTRNMLTFSRSDKAEFQNIDLRDPVNSAMHIIKHTMPKHIHIDLDLPSRPCPTVADSTQLEQVIINLVTNARDAIGQEPAGRIDIALTGEEESLVLSVSDNGAGMDPATVDKIFDPFFTTKEIGQGTGLGLSTIYGIIHRHEGTIQVKSQKGRGTTFRIMLPVRDWHQQGEGHESEPRVGQAVDARTLLIADDEEMVRETIKELLQPYGLRILEASDGQEAMDVYERQSQSIDVVLMDLGMPKKSGEQCMREFLQINPGVKIIVSSGYSTSPVMESPREFGAVTSIHKPYSVSSLLETLSHVLNEQPG